MIFCVFPKLFLFSVKLEKMLKIKQVWIYYTAESVRQLLFGEQIYFTAKLGEKESS